MLTFQVKESAKLVFSWPDVGAAKGFTTRSVKIPGEMDHECVLIISEAVVRRASRLSTESYGGYVHALSRTFRHIDRSGQKFPPTNWDVFLYEHFSSHIVDTSITYPVRIAEWHKIKDIYNELQRRGFIPANSLIPTASLQGGCHDSAAHPIGYGKENLKIPTSVGELLPKWKLSEHDLELDDDAYISKLREKIKTSANAVVDACSDYWNAMRKCHQIGRDLIDKISDEEIEKVLKSNNFMRDGLHIAHPSQPLGINWFLAVLKHYLKKTNVLTAISSDQLMEIPFFRPIIYVNSTRRLWLHKIREIAGNTKAPGQTVAETLSRLLGLLSPRDCAAACCILISENPSFPPYSLISANLYTQAGKFYLRARSGEKRLIFSVDKPRAGKRKTSQLPPLSAQIVADIIECTEIPRAVLKRQGKSSWRKLFLTANKSQISFPGRAVGKIMAFNKGVTLYSALKKSLIPAGVEDRDFNLSTLRTNQGILVFLEFGSLRKVADTLNNSVQVVRSRYIPPWLIIRWATRAIRRMQQKLIVVATEGSPWQLDATDFQSADALRTFISKMLREIKNGDAFSEIIKKRLGKYATSENSLPTPLADKELLIGIDDKTIAALYTYVDIYPEPITPSIVKSSHSDKSTVEMSDSDIRQISSLLMSTASLIDNDLTMAESAIIDKMTGDSVTEFRQLHARAQKEVMRYKIFLGTDAQFPT